MPSRETVKALALIWLVLAGLIAWAMFSGEQELCAICIERPAVKTWVDPQNPFTYRVCGTCIR